jgi:hypothetical protein
MAQQNIKKDARLCATKQGYSSHVLQYASVTASEFHLGTTGYAKP